jgi:hypothetical protein
MYLSFNYCSILGSLVFQLVVIVIKFWITQDFNKEKKF